MSSFVARRQQSCRLLHLLLSLGAARFLLHVFQKIALWVMYDGVV
jgi:hypothetical protein